MEPPATKGQRRLAENREAARKSRLRKKAYVQQLETNRLKLMQLEQELDRDRQQVKWERLDSPGLYLGGGIDAGQLGFSDTITSGIASFEMEYGHWLEEESRQVFDLRTALNAHISDAELRILVDGGMSHYFDLFRMKMAAAKADVFYLMSGNWKTAAERLFLWIGGFRPSELLKVLVPQLDPLTDRQVLDVCNLKQSCLQAEDALSQVMDKLQQNMAETVAAGRLGEGSYIPHMATAMEKLKALVSFVNQADHLRQETLQQMYRILTTRQQARGLIAMGEYFQRLRALSTLWANRPRIASFEMEYGHWLEGESRQIFDLRTALNAHISDAELRILVDGGMSHYFELFRMKMAAANADVFYLMYGMWTTAAEHFFLWIGGFRPSELLKVLVPQLDPLTDQQVLDVCNLKQSCQKAEDSLSQGMDKLQQTLAETVAAGRLGEGSYTPHMATAMEKLEVHVNFVNQADHLRQVTLQHMYHILTTRQQAQGLLAMGEYFQRLRALSTLRANHPRAKL